MLQVSASTLQQVEPFKYFGMVYTSDERRNKETDTRIGKANGVLHELCHSVVTKQTKAFKCRKVQILNRSLFRSSPVIMNLGRLG